MDKIVLIAIILFGFIYNTLNATCPNGTIQSFSGSNCYWFSNLTSNFATLNFIEAEVYCHGLSGHLVSLHDAFDNIFLADKAEKAFPNANNYWIGGDDYRKKGNWVWEDKTAFDFVEWAQGEPSGFGNCIGAKTGHGLWYAFDCTSIKPFVCQLPPSPPTTIITIAPPATTLNVKTSLILQTTSTVSVIPNTTQQPTTFLSSTKASTPSSNTNCPNGSVEWNSNCYIFQTTATSFGDAIVKCKNIKGNLVSIHDALMNTIIASEAPNYFTDSTSSDFWIGASKLIHAGTWSWIDNSVFDFADWSNGEPQNTAGLDCASMSIFDGTWAAQDCFKLKPYVCSLIKTYSKQKN